MALCYTTPTFQSKLSYHFYNTGARRTNGPRPRGNPTLVPMASLQVSDNKGGNMATFEEGKLERPKWAGETPLSRFVATLISIKPLFSILKLGARQVLIRAVQLRRVAFPGDRIQDPSLMYPDYYLNPFHAYDEGNLSWLAAAEAEPATMSMVKRAIPNASTVDEANKVVRGNWLQAIEQHYKLNSVNSAIKDILDIGCSVGVSTRFLADRFPSAKVTGLDLSPYFLAVAQFKDKERAPRENPINWIHANGESTGLPSNSYDLVSLAYVIHECPTRAIVGLVKEAFRLLRPGGMLALTDNSPKSKILQELSPVLFTLMKSTEPFLDEYYLTDVEQTMREAGFVNVYTTLTDPRHRTVMGIVP